jgi:predicted acylesterase/phospholipase RssA
VFFFRPIRIGDRDVVDGGVSEVCPLEIAVERGANVIVFVNPWCRFAMIGRVYAFLLSEGAARAFPKREWDG